MCTDQVKQICVHLQQFSRCWGSIVIVVTRLWAGQLRNHGSIPDRGKRLLFSSASGALSFLFIEYWALYLGVEWPSLKLYALLRLKMSGSIPPLLLVPLWHAQAWHYFYLYLNCQFSHASCKEDKNFKTMLTPLYVQNMISCDRM